MPPGRYLIDATDHTEASRLVEERRHEKPDTKGISAQAWGIVPKIREVDEFIRANPQCLEWLFEVHPEVCFLEWFGHLPSKRKSAVGQIERLALVRRGFPDAERAILEDLNVTDGVDLTDVLDAYASLWTALRLTEEEHETLASETPDGITAKMIV
jgi:predicted RNase H-like nuclease